MKYLHRFRWDSAKAAANEGKHGVSFERAATLFRDPFAISVYDNEHSSVLEARWITLGQADNGALLVVVHTYTEIDDSTVGIRLISARKATRKERQQYEGG